MFLIEPDRTMILQAIDFHAVRMGRAGLITDKWWELYRKVSAVDPEASEIIDSLATFAAECEKISDDELAAQTEEYEVAAQSDECDRLLTADVRSFVASLNEDYARALYAALLTRFVEQEGKLAYSSDPAGATKQFVENLPSDMFENLKDAVKDRLCGEIDPEILEKFIKANNDFMRDLELEKSDAGNTQADYGLRNREKPAPSVGHVEQARP